MGKVELFDARADLRRYLDEMKQRGFHVTSMHMTKETAKEIGVALNVGGFGEFEGVRIKAQL